MLQSQLSAFIQALDNALQADNWQRVAELDDEMRGLVNSAVDYIQAHPDSPQAQVLTQQITELSSLYQRAQAQVGEHHSVLQRQLASVPQGKAGVKAYAQQAADDSVAKKPR